VTPSAKRQAIAILHETHGLSVQRACQAVRLSRTAYYQPPGDGVQLFRDRPVIDALQALVAMNTRWGFWKCYDRLRFDGHEWNHKRVHRVYCALRLNLPRRTRRRVPRRLRTPLIAAAAVNTTWAIDFMVDTLYDGRRFRTFNVIAESNREGFAIEVGTTLPALRVIAVLEELIALHGAPRSIRCDNGPELTSLALTAWYETRGIALRYIQPGKPSQNAFIERVNRTTGPRSWMRMFRFGDGSSRADLRLARPPQHPASRTTASVACRRSPIDRDPLHSRCLFSNCELDRGAYQIMSVFHNTNDTNTTAFPKRRCIARSRSQEPARSGRHAAGRNWFSLWPEGRSANPDCTSSVSSVVGHESSCC
jgi:putative transposase